MDPGMKRGAPKAKEDSLNRRLCIYVHILIVQPVNNIITEVRAYPLVTSSPPRDLIRLKWDGQPAITLSHAHLRLPLWIRPKINDVIKVSCCCCCWCSCFVFQGEKGFEHICLRPFKNDHKKYWELITFIIVFLYT